MADKGVILTEVERVQTNLVNELKAGQDQKATTERINLAKKVEALSLQKLAEKNFGDA